MSTSLRFDPSLRLRAGLRIVSAASVLSAATSVASIALFTPGCGDSDGNPGGTGGTRNGSGGASGAGSSSGSSGSVGSGSAPGVPSAGGTGLDACPEFAEGNDLAVCTAGYSSSPGDEDGGGLAISPSGAVLHAGPLGAAALALSPATLLAGGAAGITIYSPSGREVIAAVSLGDQVTDVAVGPAGTIAVVGDFGVAVLDAAGAELLWSSELRGGGGTKVSVGKGGAVAAAAGTKVDLFAADGSPLGEVDIDQNRETPSVVLDDENELLIAAGYNQRDGGGCTVLQVPFIRAYDYSGAVVWKNYDWSHADVAAADECADSRGYHITLGGDGKLYYAGESHGGNSVHRRLPRDLGEFAPNVNPDSYQDGYNMNGAAPMGYIARFDPATGNIELGSTFVVRLPDTKGNALRPRAVAATASGHVAFVGASACCIEDATSRTVNGIPAMPDGTYAGGGFLMILSPDFESRLSWTTFNGATGGNANGLAVAARGGAIAALFQQGAGEAESVTSANALITVDAAQDTPGGGATDAYFTVLRAPE